MDHYAGKATVLRTKNGEPIVAALSQGSIAELKKLPVKEPNAFVFAGRTGRPFQFRALWVNVTTDAGLSGRNFYQIRHGCGHAWATAGVNLIYAACSDQFGLPAGTAVERREVSRY